MESFECDVVVIGAGLSGLSAAYFLTKKDRGLRIAVLEAKDRIGGRTLTRQLASADGSKDFWDIGGEWIGRPQIHLQYLLRKFNINTFNPVSPHDGSKIINVPGISWQTRLDLSQFTWKLQRLKKKLSRDDLRNSVDALIFDGITFEQYKDENLWTDEARKLVDSACRCMFGLASSEMTLLYFLMYIQAAGGLEVFVRPKEYTGAESRVKGGVQQLASHLVNHIGKKFVYLKQPVTEIVQSIEGARITTSNNMQILCQRVIMAIPPHHAAGIKYLPPLPAPKLGLLQSVPLAFLVKFAITYEEAFWKDANQKFHYGFQGVLEHSELGPVGMVYDASSGRGNPALAGFVASQGLVGDAKTRQANIMALVETLTGPLCHKYLEFSQMDWSKEPYNGGCFLKSLMPGTTKYFNSELREPFDRIHFAGTETATVWCGFMNGAVQSGFRAASEVLYHLRPLIIANPDPEFSYTDSSEANKSSVKSWLTWTAVGVGCAYGIFLIAKNVKMSSGTTFVKNIQLVLTSPNK